jgi:serine/threonine protein kinase
MRFLREIGLNRSTSKQNQCKFPHAYLDLIRRLIMCQVANHEPYNEKVDIYSFSLIVWQMFTGQKPFADIKSKEAFYRRVFKQHFRPAIPSDMHPALAELITACWSHSPEMRPSFDHIVAVLAEVPPEQAVLPIVNNPSEATIDSCSSAPGCAVGPDQQCDVGCVLS